MKKRIPQVVKRAGSAGSTIMLGICLSTSIVANSLAKPGKGKGGAPPVPFVYRVTWIESENPDDELYLRDVAPDGTVVGAIRPGGVYADQVPFVSFAVGSPLDVSPLDVQGMLHTAGKIPATWRATYAFRICDNGLIAVDIYDDGGRMYSGALLPNPDGSLGSFSLFGDPDVPEGDPAGLDAILLDASESGEFLIAVGDFTDGFGTGIRTSNPVDLHVWTPLLGSSFELASGVTPGEKTTEGWFSRSKISDYPAAIFPMADSVDPTVVQRAFFAYTDSLTPTPLPVSDTWEDVVDVGADGTVVATIGGAQIRRNRVEPPSVARWRPDDREWEILFNGQAGLVNGSGEIVAGESDSILVFQDTFKIGGFSVTGAIRVNDMIDPSQDSGWDTSGRHRLLGLSNIASGSPGGVILGQELSGSYRHFILTPVAP